MIPLKRKHNSSHVTWKSCKKSSTDDPTKDPCWESIKIPVHPIISPSIAQLYIYILCVYIYIHIQGGAPYLAFSWFIGTISLGLMNGGYIELVHGIYKPTFTSLGGHHLVCIPAPADIVLINIHCMVLCRPYMVASVSEPWLWSKYTGSIMAGRCNFFLCFFLT